MKTIYTFLLFLLPAFVFGQDEKPLRKNGIGIGLVDINPIGIQYNRFLDANNHVMAHIGFSINAKWDNKKYRVGCAYLLKEGKGFTTGLSVQHREIIHRYDKSVQRYQTFSVVADAGWTFVIKNRISIHPNLGFGFLFIDQLVFDKTDSEARRVEKNYSHFPVDFDASLRFNYLF